MLKEVSLNQQKSIEKLKQSNLEVENHTNKIVRENGIIKGVSETHHLFNNIVGKINYGLTKMHENFIQTNQQLTAEEKNKYADIIRQTQFLLLFLLGPEFTTLRSEPFYDENLRSFFEFIGKNFGDSRELMDKTSVILQKGEFIFKNWAVGSTTFKAIELILHDLNKKYKIENNK